MLACFVCLCHHPRSPFTNLTRALFFGPCHCSYIFIPCLAFRVHVAGDLNKTILSFIVGVLTTSLTRQGFLEKFYLGVRRLIPGPQASGFLAETSLACFYSKGD